MRSALIDKALPVQRAACAVLANLFPDTTTTPATGLSPSVGMLSFAEIEALISQVMKAFDGADIDTTTRLALARLVGHLLGLTQVLRTSTAPVKSPPQSNAPAADEASTAGAAKPQAEVISKPLVQPVEMMTTIGTWMSKQTTSRKQRVGLLHAYSALFNQLGPSWVETNYGLILTHLAKDLINAPKVSMGPRADKAWVRKAVGILLRDVIGERMLSEQGIISAVIEGVNGMIRPFLSAILFAASNSNPMSQAGGGMSGTATFIRGHSSEKSPSVDTMIIILKELAGLLRQLGNAPPVVQELLGGGEVLITVACSSSGAGVRGSAVSVHYFMSSTSPPIKTG
jgi:HEAT repeat-containing protein 5